MVSLKNVPLFVPILFCTSLLTVNCTGGFKFLTSSGNDTGLGSPNPAPSPTVTPVPTASPSPTASPTPNLGPQACENLGTIPPITQLGPNWNPAAYSFIASLVDGSIVRPDFMNDPTGTLTITRTFQMPFVSANLPGLCQTIVTQVQLPNPNLHKVSLQIPCPNQSGAPVDMTNQVNAALTSLAQTQANDANAVVPQSDSLELDFVPNCTYTFISQPNGPGYAINVPDVTDLTISGGSSLDDGATLIFANPTALIPSTFDPNVYLVDGNSPRGPNATPQDAIHIKSGGQRIQLTNLNIRGTTPPIIGGTTQWNVSIPYVDFGTVSTIQNPNGKGTVNILTVPTNVGTQMIYSTYYRQVVTADPNSPQQQGLLTGSPLQTEINSNNLSDATYSGNLQGVVINSSGLSKLPPGPVKIFHETGAGNGANFVFGISEPSNTNTIQDISLINIKVSDWNGLAFGVGMSRGLALENFHIAPSGSALRTITGGGLIVGQLNSDLIVENSEFSYGADDDMNIRSDIDQLTSAGVYDSGTNSTSFSVKNNINNLVSGEPICVFSSQFDPMFCASTMQKSGTTITVTGDQHALIPSNGLLVRTDRYAVRLYIVGNTFTGNRARGILMKGSNAYIANNMATNTQGPGFFVSPGNQTYTEGPISRNVIITGNTVNSNSGGLQYGAIATAVQAPNSNAVPSQTLQNILIENNTIGTAEDSPGVLTASSGNVVVRNNNLANNYNLVPYSQGSFWQAYLALMTQLGQTPNPLAPICTLNPQN